MSSGIPSPRPRAHAAMARAAIEVGAPVFRHGAQWSFAPGAQGFSYRGVAERELPRPSLAGPHQVANAATAVAVAEMLPGRLRLADAAIAAGVAGAQWPARLQRLSRGPLAAALPAGCELWLDGGHNEDGARVFRHGAQWSFAPGAQGFSYRGVAARELPRPSLAGPHQVANAATAVAVAEMLPGRLRLADAAITAGVAGAQWPARLQRLSRGPLAAALPAGCELWLDGG
ncbi:MAG: hypothetical protein ACKOUS_03285, partial [Alphaproteobacteria bacterium]